MCMYHTDVCMYVHVCMYVRMYVCLCACMYVNIYRLWRLCVRNFFYFRFFIFYFYVCTHIPPFLWPHPCVIDL